MIDEKHWIYMIYKMSLSKWLNFEHLDTVILSIPFVDLIESGNSKTLLITLLVFVIICIFLQFRQLQLLLNLILLKCKKHKCQLHIEWRKSGKFDLVFAKCLYFLKISNTGCVLKISKNKLHCLEIKILTNWNSFSITKIMFEKTSVVILASF